MRTVTCLIVLLCVGLLAGCGSDEKKTATKDDLTALTRASQDEILFEKAAKQLAQSFARDLVGELRQAVKEGGAVNAIYVCSERAPEVATTHSGEYWSIVRVSDRNRNPANRTDSTQLEIMKQFADSTASEFFARWDDDQGGRVYRYYQPIYTKLFCLKCHGKPEKLGVDVDKAIAESYPDDLATGYDVGELRGMLVVEAIWPEGKDHAEELISTIE